jgi:hypothetical protein
LQFGFGPASGGGPESLFTNPLLPDELPPLPASIPAFGSNVDESSDPQATTKATAAAPMMTARTRFVGRMLSEDRNATFTSIRFNKLPSHFSGSCSRRVAAGRRRISHTEIDRRSLRAHRARTEFTPLARP